MEDRLKVYAALSRLLSSPRYYLKPAREAMKEVVKARIEAFGQAGHAGDYEPISLEEMADRYREEGHQLTTDRGIV
jgi:fructose-bisphosphate aldolase, class II